jgi:2-methylfumaryl-CoA isomerase
MLGADFAACGDPYVHRVAIAPLLAPWFARRTVTDVAAAFAGTWARLNTFRLAGPPALS